MSVLSRPMFRQAGGPAAPMPQDMAPPMPPPPMASEMAGPPPEIAMLEQAETGAMAQGQELGAAYAQQMMASIDGAQSTEDLINALRGNEMTLGDRRDELAEYVGQSDADKTPESVLAMVQPVIMMTEEGMMNSGIGALVQQIAGDVDMATEGGQPTDMGMGVGSLMMAGAQEAPAPQNFRQGGEVAYLKNGSDPVATAPVPTASEKLLSTGFGSSVQRFYDDLLPVFQEIVSDKDRAEREAERKSMDKAQILFRLAQAGLDTAAGVPGAGSSPVSQLSAAFSPALGDISGIAARSLDRQDAIRAEDQQLRLSALQTGITQATAEENFLREKLLEKIRVRGRRAALGVDERIVSDSSGQDVAVLDLNDAEDLATYNDYKSDGSYTFRKMGSGGAEPLTNYVIQAPSSEDGLLTRTLVESFDNGRTYVGPDGEPVPMPMGENISIAAIPKEEAAALQRSIGSEDKYRGLLKKVEEEGIGPATAAMTSASNTGSVISSAAIMKDQIEEKTGQPFDLTNASNIREDIETAKRSAYQAAMDGTGPVAALQSGINSFIGFATELDPEDAQREQYRALLRAIRFVGKVALVSNSRFPVAEMALASDLFPNPDTFFADPEVEAQKLQVIMEVTDQLYLENLRELASGGLNSTQRAEAENNMRQVQLLRSLLGNVPKAGEEQFTQDRFTGYGQQVTESGRTGIN